ncbi:hypothetical protein Nos7107_3146 [Nostoc sp. PCC 7107]|nr:hypothetical protein Nos7107_3146 [Nostoc sp. PCC 7107]
MSRLKLVMFYQFWLGWNITDQVSLCIFAASQICLLIHKKIMRTRFGFMRNEQALRIDCLVYVLSVIYPSSLCLYNAIDPLFVTNYE